MHSYAGGADSSGYLNAAKLLGELQLSAVARPLPAEVIAGAPDEIASPLGFRPIDHKLVPVYPLGLPLLIAISQKLFGVETGAVALLWFHSLLAILLVYAIALELGLSRPAAVISTLLFAFCPLVIFSAVQMMSDLPATVWVSLSVFSLLRTQKSLAWNVLAGFAFGVSVLIRPTDIVIFPIVIFANWKDARSFVACISGAIPCFLFLAITNTILYKSPLASGYPGAGNLFNHINVFPTLERYLTSVPIAITPLWGLIFAFPVWIGKMGFRNSAIMAIWMFSFFVVYAYYQYTQDSWWYLRFVLPASPPLIILACCALDEMWGQHKQWRYRLSYYGFFVAAAIWLIICVIKLPTYNVGDEQRIFKDTATWVQEHVPADSILLTMHASGTFTYYTQHSVIRYDWMKEDQWRHMREYIKDGKISVYAVLFPFEVQDFKDRKYPCTLAEMGQISEVKVFKVN